MDETPRKLTVADLLELRKEHFKEDDLPEHVDYIVREDGMWEFVPWGDPRGVILNSGRAE